MDIQVIASGSKGNCYTISAGKTTLMLECGISYREIQRALNFDLSSIKACLITHEHKDHCKAYKDLLKRGIPLGMSKGTRESLDIATGRIIELETRKEIIIGDFKVKPFDVVHDCKEPLGFQIESLVTKERLVFFTDTMYSKYTFKEIDYYMVECNYTEDKLNTNREENRWLNRVKRSHMSLETLVEFFKATDLNKTKEIYLMHLSDTNSDYEWILKTIRETTGKIVRIC